MPTATESSFQWSDLARHSSEVSDALDRHGEVTVNRGRQQLRLGPAPSPTIVDVVRDLCALLAALVEHEQPDHVSAVLTRAWPWTRALPAEDQLLLAKEAGETAEMCESLATWKPLTDLLNDWRGTARAWADGATPVRVDKPLGVPVPRPS